MTESFDQKDFAQRVNEELNYLGMEKQHLANCIYISEVRLTWGLRFDQRRPSGSPSQMAA